MDFYHLQIVLIGKYYVYLFDGCDALLFALGQLYNFLDTCLGQLHDCPSSGGQKKKGLVTGPVSDSDEQHLAITCKPNVSSLRRNCNKNLLKKLVCAMRRPRHHPEGTGMKWFKHFTDNHRGRTMQLLFDEMGHTGIASWYILMEICAEKMERKSDKTLESSDCLFEFHERILRQNLRISPTNLRHLLDICQGFGLLSFEFSGNLLKISFPILLDLLEYDQKKFRPRRASVAPKNRLYTDKDTYTESDTDKEPDKELNTLSAPKNYQKPNSELNRKIWESYRSAYSVRYGVDPVRNASVNSKISALGKRLGESAIDLMWFYLQHNDAFYLKKIHDIGLALKDAESLHTQMLRGKTVTSKDVSNFEKIDGFRRMQEDMKKGGF